MQLPDFVLKYMVMGKRCFVLDTTCTVWCDGMGEAGCDGMGSDGAGRDGMGVEWGAIRWFCCPARSPACRTRVFVTEVAQIQQVSLVVQ